MDAIKSVVQEVTAKKKKRTDLLISKANNENKVLVGMSSLISQLENINKQSNNNNDNNNNKKEPEINKKKLYDEFIALYMASNVFDAQFLVKLDKYCLGDVERDPIFWIRFESMIRNKIGIDNIIAVLKIYIG